MILLVVEVEVDVSYTYTVHSSRSVMHVHCVMHQESKCMFVTFRIMC